LRLFKRKSESVALMTADKIPVKKSPYREDTGIPDLLCCCHAALMA
jgi:hypothetical protein